MPWTGPQFRERHNHHLTPSEAASAAAQANAMLRRGVSDRIAIATANKRFERADGGSAPTSLADAGDGQFHPSTSHHSGFVASMVPGRTDRLPRTVPADSFVIPADVVSIAGGGNSLAGADIWGKILGMDTAPKAFAGGGHAPTSDVILAGGEIVVPPDVVRRKGGGSMEKGQAALREAVKRFRGHEIARLKNAPSPKR